MGEVMVIITGDTYCNSQVILRGLYALVIIQHGKVSFMLIVNSDKHLVRDIEDRILPGHGEGALCILKYLELHEMILRDQESTLEVGHEENIALQD